MLPAADKINVFRNKDASLNVNCMLHVVIHIIRCCAAVVV